MKAPWMNPNLFTMNEARIVERYADHTFAFALALAVLTWLASATRIGFVASSPTARPPKFQSSSNSSAGNATSAAISTSSPRTFEFANTREYSREPTQTNPLLRRRDCVIPPNLRLPSTEHHFVRRRCIRFRRRRQTQSGARIQGILPSRWHVRHSMPRFPDMAGLCEPRPERHDGCYRGRCVSRAFDARADEARERERVAERYRPVDAGTSAVSGGSSIVAP